MSKYSGRTKAIEEQIEGLPDTGTVTAAHMKELLSKTFQVLVAELQKARDSQLGALAAIQAGDTKKAEQCLLVDLRTLDGGEL